MANRLQDETSPYLQQHAHNPVDWYPWGDGAFARARAENKPVLVSIGYAACHWCHVMERESFEDAAVAAYMNEHFISIKVDREEHPDVDHLYMDALQAMSGSGGWPLNMFVTPERKPFYGGTYFPPQKMYNRASWMDILKAVKDSWQFKRDEIEAQSKQLLLHLHQSSLIASDSNRTITKDMADLVAGQLLRQADDNYGGFGQAPKFPSTMSLIYLLQHYHYTKDEKSLDHALFSLEAMIKGGIYDQVGGGFARYATDNQWLVPHFEKMLYDNALLVSAMSHAYRITGEPLYRNTIEATIDFCNRELSDGNGFYCALDADSEGVEGKYYTWTWQEWQQALPDVHPALAEYFGITEEGNWEGVNILNIAGNALYLADKYQLQGDKWQELLDQALGRLTEVRNQRVRPGTDDKMMLSWNALMNQALTDAALALGNDRYMQQAASHMEWMLETFSKDDELLHIAKNGIAKIPAKLDDYAYLIRALFSLASGTGNNSHISTAHKLIGYVIGHFSDDEGRFFFFSSDKQLDIPVRKVEIYDGATPSANAVMMENLYLSGILMEDMSHMRRSEQMLRDMAQAAIRYPLSFSNWAIFLQHYANGIRQLVIAGADAKNILRDWSQYYFPGIYSFPVTTDRTGIPALDMKYRHEYNSLYLCEQFSCKKPFADIESLLKAINF